VLILAPLTIDLHMFTPRLMRFTAFWLYRLNNFFLQTQWLLMMLGYWWQASRMTWRCQKK